MSQAGILDVASSNPQIATRYDANTGFAIPIANVLEILGTGGITTDGSGNTITISLAGGGSAIEEIGVDASTAPGTDPVVPDGAGLITVTGAQVSSNTVGANVIRTNSLAVNTYTIEVQQAGESGVENTSLNGVSHYNSGQFNVSNGFVSLANPYPGFIWQTIIASRTLAINNGYICISPGGALSLALPATATIGDIIEVVLDGSTSWTITQSAGQQIRFGNVQTTSGAGGSLASTAAGDTIRMVAQTASKWNILSSVGVLTVT